MTNKKLKEMYNEYCKTEYTGIEILALGKEMDFEELKQSSLNRIYGAGTFAQYLGLSYADINEIYQHWGNKIIQTIEKKVE